MTSIYDDDPLIETNFHDDKLDLDEMLTCLKRLERRELCVRFINVRRVTSSWLDCNTEIKLEHKGESIIHAKQISNIYHFPKYLENIVAQRRW